MAVVIRTGGRTEDAKTVNVNRHGALIACPAIHPVGSVLRIRNLTSGQEARFRVVWVAPAANSWDFKLGVEMLDESPTFWGPRYDSVARAVEKPGAPPALRRRERKR